MGLVAEVSEKPLSTDPMAGVVAPVAAVPVGPHPEAKMSARAPDFSSDHIRPDALPPEIVDALGNRKVVGPETERFMTTPLAHPTGIDAIDSFLSPASLALMAPSAVSAVKGAVTGLAENVGTPLARKVLKFVTPAALKKPAEFVDLLNEIGNAVRAKAEPPAAPAAPAPATAAPVAKTAMQAALDDFLAKAEARRGGQAPAGAAPPASTPADAPTSANAAPVAAAPAGAVSAPNGVTPAPPVIDPAAQAVRDQTAAPATPMKMSDRLNLFMRESRKAGVTLSPNDYLALNKAVAAGTAPGDAISALLAERNPAAALAKLPGMMTDDEVRAALDARNAAGQIKTPSAETARARKGGR